MANQTGHPRRRVRRSRTALPIADTQTPEGARLAYRRLGAQLNVLSWTADEAVFLAREQWVWDQLIELARARGVIDLSEERAGTT